MFSHSSDVLARHAVRAPDAVIGHVGPEDFLLLDTQRHSAHENLTNPSADMSLASTTHLKHGQRQRMRQLLLVIDQPVPPVSVHADAGERVQL